MRDFESKNDERKRSPRRRSKHRPHRHQRKRSRRKMRRRHQPVHHHRKHAAYRRARHEHRRQQSTRRPGTQRNHQRQRFKYHDQQQQLQRQTIIQNIRKRVISNAQNARHKKSDNPQSQRPNRRMPQFAHRQPLKLILHPIKQLRKSNRRGSANKPQHQVVRQASRHAKIDAADLKHRVLPKQQVPHARSQRARNHQRNKGPRPKLEKQKLDRQNHARQRRIESRRHSRRGASRQQRFPFHRSGCDNLPDQRTNRSARLNDRPFRAEWAASSNRNRRRNRFQNRDLRFNPATRSQHRLHSFRNSMPFDFVRPVFRHQPDNESANHRNHNHPIAEVRIFGTAKMK